MRPELMYIMDPLCGWCYGFSPVVEQLHKEYKDKMDFTVIVGGMMTGVRVEPVAAMAQYILGAYKRVEEYSGAAFGEPYLAMLREGTEISNSEPPCRAIYTFRQKHPERVVEYTHALQQKLFKEGKSLNEKETYIQLAKEFGIDAEAFITDWESEASRYGTLQDFQWAQAARITGFPCTVLKLGEEYYMVARGFQPYQAVKETVERILDNPGGDK